jgi:hypothetical protein
MPNDIVRPAELLPATRPMLRVTNVRPLRKNTLVAFVSVEHVSGLILHEVSIHSRDGKWWASPPARQILIDGRHALDEHGKGRWQPLADFRSRDLRNNWSDAVIAAFHRSFGAADGGAL